MSTSTFLKSTQAELRVTFYGSAGTPVDATGTPTVTITREDGTALVTAANTTKPASTTGIYAYTLTAAQTASLDQLTAVWTGVVEGASQSFTTYAEIVGGFVCSLAEIDRVLNRGGASSDYSVDLKNDARAIATAAFEQECGVAFAPRYRRQKLSGDGTYILSLPTPQIRTVRAVTVDDTALTQAEIDALDVDDVRGQVGRATTWPTPAAGKRNVTMTWEHGYRTPPADVSRAVALIASSILADGPWDDRGFAVTDDGGSVRLLTAGVSGAAFSIPDVQAALARHQIPAIA